MRILDHRLTRLAAATFVAIATIAAPGCGGSEAPPQPESDAAQTETDPAEALLARGEYLVEGVAHCFYCHSEVDWTSPDPKPLPGRKGSGGILPDKGLPGRVVASNISPDPETGIGSWTDEELDRAIREGIGRDGRRLFPVMPDFSKLSDEDLAAVIAYLRSVPPVSNQPPPTELPPPVKAALPPPNPLVRPVAGPDPNDSAARGAYLAIVGECVACHTPMTPQGPVFEMAFGGGFLLDGAWGSLVSPNITWDPSGISYYERATFHEAMREGRVGARKLNPIMPSGYFRMMTDEDLDAILAFLKTVKPVQHRVDNTEPPVLCKLCGQTHGLGQQ